MENANTPTVVILNVSAGKDNPSDYTEAVTERFRAGGLGVRVVSVDGGAEIIEAAKHTMAERPQRIVAGGGDGTLSAVASVLAGTDVAMGIIPCGTRNHFAKDLGIPLELDEAVRNIVAGHSVLVDVGEVNGRVFLNNSGLGVYPEMVQLRESRQRRGHSKRSAALWATLATFRRHPFLDVQLMLNGERHTRRTPFVFVGNNEYETDGFAIGGRPRLDAGLLSLYVAHRTGRWGLLRLALRALFGLLRQSKDFDALTATEILINTRHRHLHVSADGEVSTMSPPLQYRVRPGALRVIVPRTA